MTAQRFLDDAVVAAGAAVALLLTVYLVVGLVNDLRRRLRGWMRSRSSRHIATVLFGTEVEAAEAAERLNDVPDRLILDVAQRLTIDFQGDVNERLRKLVGTLGISRHIRSRIDARSWRTRTQGAALAPLLPLHDPFRTRLVDDPHPTVRASAIGALDNAGVGECVGSLLDALSDPCEHIRFEAQQALLRADGIIVPALVEFLDSAEGAAAALALEVASKTHDPRVRAAAIAHARCDDPLRRAAAARTLVHGPADIALLTSLLDDSDPLVRAAAATASSASGAEVLAGKVGRLLGDRLWAVRVEAGAALAAMGPTGRLVLRFHLDDADPFARDIAQRTLDQLATARGDAVQPARPIHGVSAWQPESVAA